MTRRLFFDFLPLLLHPTRWRLAAARKDDIVTIANDFAAAYRDWIVIKQQELVDPGTVSAEGVRAWEVVRKRWRELDVVVRNS